MVRRVCLIFCLLVSVSVSAGQIQSFKLRFTDSPSIRKNPNPSVPLAFIVDFETNRPVRVQMYLDDGRSTRLIVDTSFNSNHVSLPVLGLRPDTTYKLKLFVRDVLGTF